MQVTRDQVHDAIDQAIPRIACRLPRDVYAAIAKARRSDKSPRGAHVLDDLLANAALAASDGVPICQDTGTVWVCLEIGPDVTVSGDVLSEVNSAVAHAYEEARLRRSVVRDAAFNRTNTGDNTPAFCEIRTVEEQGCAKLHIMLKGGGSDNASKVEMLVPGAGHAGIIDTVLKRVREKAANACAPLVVGVGIGATFDKVAGLAKHALMRPVGERAATSEASLLERQLEALIAESEVGAGGLGGPSAALAVHVETAPCHIAALPVAVNMGCSALRRATIDLASGESVASQLDRQLISGADVADADDASSQAASSGECVNLKLPLRKEDLAGLKAGQRCLLSGPLYTLRDAGHERMIVELKESCGALPYGLEGQTLFYAGPTPAACGRPFGAVGPTTAGRMDFAAPALYDAGIAATIGKGPRSEAVREACKRNGCVYFVATGGAAALLAKRVMSAEVVAYGDLGTEALRRIEVKDFPVFVGVDANGDDVYKLKDETTV